jgi:hypothetical protein
MSRAPKPEWDTPPHGDFAAYVERLSGAVPGAQSAGRLLQASRPATRPNPKLGPGKHTEAVSAVQSKATAPGPYSVWEPLSRIVRVVRGVLLLSAAVQMLMLFVLEQGSWWGLCVTALMWWGLGRVASMVRTVLTLPGIANADQGIAQLKKQLADLAQQKNTGKRK